MRSKRDAEFWQKKALLQRVKQSRIRRSDNPERAALQDQLDITAVGRAGMTEREFWLALVSPKLSKPKLNQILHYLNSNAATLHMEVKDFSPENLHIFALSDLEKTAGDSRVLLTHKDPRVSESARVSVGTNRFVLEDYTEECRNLYCGNPILDPLYDTAASKEEVAVLNDIRYNAMYIPVDYTYRFVEYGDKVLVVGKSDLGEIEWAGGIWLDFYGAETTIGGGKSADSDRPWLQGEWLGDDVLVGRSSGVLWGNYERRAGR